MHSQESLTRTTRTACPDPRMSDKTKLWITAMTCGTVLLIAGWCGQHPTATQPPLNTSQSFSTTAEPGEKIRLVSAIGTPP